MLLAIDLSGTANRRKLRVTESGSFATDSDTGLSQAVFNIAAAEFELVAEPDSVAVQDPDLGAFFAVTWLSLCR